MIYHNLYLHNVAEIEERPIGTRLYRFPRAVCDAMGNCGSTYGRYVSQTTTGCEIRFVTSGDRTLVSLSAIDEDGYVQVYRGDFRYYTGYVYSYPVKKGEVTHIMLLKAPGFESLDDRFKKKEDGFSSDVWRIMSDINFTMTLVDFESYGADVRPPRADEMPAKTLLTYGTSLTYGACASAHSIAYVQLLGRLLNCNILNKAMGGSCRNEDAVAEYFISDAVQFDGVLLENGINMKAEDYRQYGSKLTEKLATACPDIPIYCVTPYPNVSNITGDGPVPCVKIQEGEKALHSQYMKEIASKYKNCRVIEGADMLTDFTGLTCDLVHLSDYGHIMVAQNLSKVINL